MRIKDRDWPVVVGGMLTAIALAASIVVTEVRAQTFPRKNVTLIIPFSAGGPTDALGRVIANSMSASLGRQVLVENVAGAGGLVARTKIAQSEPDGHLLMFAGLGTATSATLYRKLPYDPINAFDAVGLVAKVPMVIVGRKDLPAKDVGELLRYIRATRDKFTYGDGGLGSGSQFCGMLLMSALNVKATPVSYKGSGPAMLDLIGGRIDLVCDQTTTTLSQMRNGLVKGYAVTMKNRVSVAPDLPTLHEAGLNAFELSNWYGLMGARGMPKAVLEQLSASIKTALADPGVQKRLDEFGAVAATPDLVTPDGFAAFYRGEVERWAPLIRAAGIYAD